MTGGLTRVMIVDDEDVFRSHLKSMLNWPTHGFCICAEAGGGREAMEMLGRHDPDIVITDIQMPDIDGLALIAHMAAEYPHIQTIALSGYDEYKYVRTGMKHGVLDYLLKHQITPGSLLEAAVDARRRIDDRRSQVIAARTFAEQAEIGLSELRRCLLQELLAGNINTKTELTQRAKKVGLDVSGGYYVLMAAEIDNMNLYKSRYSEAEWMMFFSQVTDMVKFIAGDSGGRQARMGLMAPQPESRFTVLFSMPAGYSFMYFYSYINTCIQNIRTALKEHFSITACYSVSAHISDFRQIPDQYARVLAKLESKIYHGQDVVFREEGWISDASAQDKASFGVDDETSIRSLLRDGHMEALQIFIDALFDRWRTVHFEPRRLQMMFAELLSILSRLARQESIDPQELMPEDCVYNRMRYMTLDEMKRFFLEGCTAFVERRSPLPDGGGRELTQKACSFIKRNYTRPISLTDVAEATGVNPSYLSRVFKADVGKTVVEYVNDIRIEAAKQMIDEGERLKDIGEKLGFNSASYFSTVFRQASGKTPTQYKKQATPK